MDARADRLQLVASPRSSTTRCRRGWGSPAGLGNRGRGGGESVWRVVTVAWRDGIRWSNRCTIPERRRGAVDRMRPPFPLSTPFRRRHPSSRVIRAALLSHQDPDAQCFRAGDDAAPRSCAGLTRAAFPRGTSPSSSDPPAADLVIPARTVVLRPPNRLDLPRRTHTGQVWRRFTDRGWRRVGTLSLPIRPLLLHSTCAPASCRFRK